MNLQKAEETRDLKSRLSNGHIEIGLYPVIYGFRVRVSVIGDSFCQLDLCGGNNLAMIDLLYNGCRKIIDGQIRENGHANFKEFPIQHRKPFFKDTNFLKEFCNLILKYQEHDIDMAEFEVTQEMLDQCRISYGLSPI